MYVYEDAFIKCGSKYFVLFKDDYSHYRVIYTPKNKNEVKVKFVHYIKQLETQNRFKMKVFRTDKAKKT